MKIKKLVMSIASLALSAACAFGSACAFAGDDHSGNDDGQTAIRPGDGEQGGTTPGGDETDPEEPDDGEQGGNTPGGDETDPGEPDDGEQGGNTPGGDETDPGEPDDGEQGGTTPGGDETDPEEPGDGEQGGTTPGGDETNPEEPDDGEQGGNTPGGGETDPEEPGDEQEPSEGVADIVTLAQAGNESVAFEWKDSAPANAKVEYKLHDGVSAYAEADGELIRATSGGARADILGLRGGASYDFKITTGDGAVLTVTNVLVSAYDRSGYAHFNYSEGVGAYNDDGTLKADAVVVYVTEETKNTVTAKIGGKTYTGLVEILQNAGKSSAPVNIRIIGTIGAATWNAIEYNTDNLTPDKVTGINGKNLPEQNLTEEEILAGGYNTLNTSAVSKLEGLTNRIKFDGGKNEFDSYYNMCDISDAKNVTVEGVGEGAGLFQWGFTWKKSNSIEVRNLTFDDYTEDACSFEGGSKTTTNPDEFDSKNIWVHHNTINEGINYWDVCSEQDKHKGDGGTDFKYNAYVTLSYNHYVGCHKTGLIGGGDSQQTASVTFHHNWYENCGSRLPLARQANMHMYNNYYDGSTVTNMSLRAGAYAFIENCFFDNAKNPVTTQDGDGKRGVAKIYNCTFNGQKLDTSKYDVEVVSDRAAKVDNDNVFNKNFDTDPSAFYYADGRSDVEIMHDTAEVPAVVPLLAGAMGGREDIDLGGSSAEQPGGETDPDQPGGETDPDQPGGETGGEENVSFTATITVEGSSLVESNSAALKYEGGVNSTKPEDQTKYSVGSNRINLGGNAAYIRLTFKASAGQAVEISVNASASADSGIAIAAENASVTGSAQYAVSTDPADFRFTLVADADGEVTITLNRTVSKTVYVHGITVSVK